MALKKPNSALNTGTDRRNYPRDYEGLLAQIQDADPMVRRWGVRDLAEHPQAGAHLVRLLETESDNSVRAALSFALSKIGNEVVVAGMVNLLRSDDPSLRNMAIEILKQLPDHVAPHMEALLVDPDADVRIFAVNVLEALCHPQVENWLIKVMQQDAHVNVVSTALDLISEVGSDAALPALAELAARFPDYPYIAFATAAAKRRIASA
jgi:HEAT repeat protein